MVLKKQTVWLLTMLSLIIVLSVYYVTSPDQSASDQMVSDQTKQADKQADVNKDKKSAIKSTITSEDKLADYRLAKADDRKKLANEYQSVISSSDGSTVEASKAYDKLEALKTLANNENLLEDMIKNKGFADALVSTNQESQSVNVYVTTDNLSSKQATTIVNLAHKYLGNDKLVSVKYDSMKG